MPKRSRTNNPQSTKKLSPQTEKEDVPLFAEVVEGFVKERKLQPEIAQELVLELSRALCVSVEQSVSFSGPMPHPDILKQYEDIVPGMAREQWNELLEEGKTDRHCKKVYTWSIILGQLIGLTLGIAGLVVGYKLVQNGADSAGIAAIFSGVTSIVASIFGKYFFNKN